MINLIYANTISKLFSHHVRFEDNNSTLLLKAQGRRPRAFPNLMCNIVLHGKMGQKWQKLGQLLMFGFQPWVGLFEVCKSLKTCPQSGYVFGMWQYNYNYKFFFFICSKKKTKKHLKVKIDMDDQTTQIGRGRGRLRTQQEQLQHMHIWPNLLTVLAEIQIRSYPDQEGDLLT